MDGLSSVRDMVAEILGFLPNLFGAVVIFFIFYIVARIVQRLAANLLATIGFAEIVNHAFTALIFGLAAAGALAFGLGGRDAASRAIEGWKGEQE